MTLARRIAIAICFLLLLSLSVDFALCYVLLPAEFSALLREYMGLILQIGLTVMVVAALVVWRFCRHQFGPLSTLVSLMNTVRDHPRGGRDASSADEIAALFKNFNQLVDELRVHRQAMSALVAEGRKGARVATILCDTGFRYLSSLYNPAWLREKGLPVFPWLDE